MSGLSHIGDDGAARMVNVSQKAVTNRSARAQAVVFTSAIEQVIAGDLPKGDVLSTARLAGILAAKRTGELIPLCHPLPIHGVDIDASLDASTGTISFSAQVETAERTGVEMEALTAVSVAALTCFDMIKAVDPEASIGQIGVLEKTGGKRGHWVRSSPVRSYS